MFKVRNLRKTHQIVAKKDEIINISRQTLTLKIEGFLSKMFSISNNT